MGNYETFHANECFGQDNSIKYLVLIIYDISSNKRRTKMAKLLESYGFRVQRSAFEAVVSMPEYLKLLKGLTGLLTNRMIMFVFIVLLVIPKFPHGKCSKHN